MELGRALAGLDELRRGLVVQFFHAGPMSGDREHVEITQLRGFLCPERFERVCRVRPALGEKIAEPQQMTGLHSVRLIADHRLEKWNSFQEFILPIIDEADVQPDSRHLRHQMFSLAQHLQSFSPLLAPHINHAEICISAAHLRIHSDHLLEVALRLVEPVLVQRLLA